MGKSALILKTDSKPIHNWLCLKTKIKFYSDDDIDFHDKEIPKVDSNHTWFAVISFKSAVNKDGNYYPQVFWKECK